MATFDRTFFETIGRSFVPIHAAGHLHMAAFAVVTLVLLWIWTPLGLLGIVATAWCVYFFRDPPRVTPNLPGLVVAPADGRIEPIIRAAPPPELGLGDQQMTRVSIFLSVFDVHVNRVPVTGEVIAVHYHPGKFLNASLDKASEENERSAVAIRTQDGLVFPVVQIAGLIARRIINDLKTGQPVVAGERYGIIRFGSRTDVYLPDGVEPLVMAGQRAVGGETVIAAVPVAMRGGEWRTQ